jgi:hypothetical protein
MACETKESIYERCQVGKKHESEKNVPWNPSFSLSNADLVSPAILFPHKNQAQETKDYPAHLALKFPTHSRILSREQTMADTE